MSLSDCADYAKTVSPYLPQLYSLPNEVFAMITNADAIQKLYLSTNPVISGLAFSILLMPVFFIVSEVTKNYSQVDRAWSILPTVYHVHFCVWAHLNGLPTQRVDNLLAFSLVWSTRLTFNYWRKGGYQMGSEDYRWKIIKKYIGAWGLVALNVVFIATIQSILLFSITTPAYVLILVSRLQPEMSMVETVLSRMLLVLVVFEYFADQQMWDYQKAKKTYQKTAKVPPGWTRAQMDRGFLTRGLWKYSRHPNFAAEQAIWLTVYLWGCIASNTVWNWTVGGVIGYMLVFQGSTPITERISSGKYPEYKLYQERVGQYAPSPLAAGWNEEKMETLGPELTKEDRKKT